MTLNLQWIYLLIFLQADKYHCGCASGFECRRYRGNRYWGKCVKPINRCSSDSSCAKTHCCSGGQCKPRKKAGEFCPLKGVKTYSLSKYFCLDQNRTHWKNKPFAQWRQLYYYDHNYSSFVLFIFKFGNPGKIIDKSLNLHKKAKK